MTTETRITENTESAGTDLDESTAGKPSGSLIPSLPGNYYVDEDVFAAEQERIFETMWFCAVRSADLDKPGAWRTVQVGRESVMVTRNRKGAIRAYYNICRHRGVKLCMEESGQAERSFQCPYHAWTYDFDGKLIAAPNLTKMPDIDRHEYGLVHVQAREYLGYIWLCLADDPPSFESDVVGAIEQRLGDAGLIDGYDVEKLVLGKRINYDVGANWKLIIENFMECYHCATIHPELTEVLPEFADGLAAQYFVGHGAEFGEDIKGFTVDGSAGHEMLPGVSPDQDRRYYAITIKPTVFVNLVPDHVIIHRMFPVSADRTLVECDWLYLPSVIESGADLGASVELFHRVNQQDFDACERCQPAMGSRVYAAGGVLVPSEHHIGEFHDWLQAALNETGSGVQPGQTVQTVPGS